MRRIYGRIIDRTGWTFPTVDALRIDEMNDLFDHWGEEPPLSVVVRALAGWEPQTPENDPATPKVVTEEEWNRMVAATKAGAQLGAQRLAHSAGR